MNKVNLKVNSPDYKALDQEFKRISAALIMAKNNLRNGVITDTYYKVLVNQYQPRRQALKVILLPYHYGANSFKKEI